MTPDELARLQAGHIYDPDAEDAPEQLQLLERLAAQGLGPEVLLAADRLGTLVLSAFEHLIRPGNRRTTAQVAVATAIAEDRLRRLWRAWGFPDPAPDEACWTDDDVAAAEFMRDTAELAGQDWALEMARAAGTAMSRVAEAEVAFVRSKVEAPLVARGASRATLLVQYERVIGSFLPSAARVLDSLHRHHLADLRRRYAKVLGPTPNNLLEVTVGFADMTGSTALVERVRLEELERTLAVFEERTTDAIARAGASLVKRLGDGVMFVSYDVAGACRLALDLVAAFPAAEGLPPIRVGMAWGTVAALRGDYFGPAVHRAARIVASAAPGSAVVVADIAAAVRAPDLAFHSLGAYRLAGFEDTVELFRCARAAA